MHNSVENLRASDGSFSLSDLFAYRVGCQKKRSEIDENQALSKTDILNLSHLEYEIDQVDRIIDAQRKAERGEEEFKVTVKETTSYTIYVKATSRTEAEEQVQQIIDNNQYWERGIAEPQGVHIYSIEEEQA